MLCCVMFKNVKTNFRMIECISSRVRRTPMLACFVVSETTSSERNQSTAAATSLTSANASGLVDQAFWFLSNYV